MCERKRENGTEKDKDRKRYRETDKLFEVLTKWCKTIISREKEIREREKGRKRERERLREREIERKRD